VVGCSQAALSSRWISRRPRPTPSSPLHQRQGRQPVEDHRLPSVLPPALTHACNLCGGSLVRGLRVDSAVCRLRRSGGAGCCHAGCWSARPAVEFVGTHGLCLASRGEVRLAVKAEHHSAQLMLVLGIDVLLCPHCAGTRRVLAAIHDPQSVGNVLGALGLSAEVLELTACRAPPGGDPGEGGDEGVAE